MSRYIKIYIQRIDGKIQKYRIARKNLKNYVKVSFRKKENRWIWVKKEIKIKLEKQKIEEELKEIKEKKFKKPKKMIKQIWHVKLIYDSPRGSYHNIITEIEITTIREKPLSEDDIKDLIDSEEVAETITGEGYPFIYNKVEIGLESEEEVLSKKEETEIKFINAYHNIDELLRKRRRIW